MADNLPPSQRSYEWTGGESFPGGSVVPVTWDASAGDGIADLRVRVVVRDLRFQNSADGDNRSFSISPGTGSAPGDLNRDGSIDALDIEPFLELLFP